MVAPYKCFPKLLFYVYINTKELRLQNYHKGGYIIYQYTRSNKAWCILEHCIVKKQFEEVLLINWLKQCRNNPVYKMHEMCIEPVWLLVWVIYKQWQWFSLCVCVVDQLYHLRTHSPKPDRGGDVENKIDRLRQDLQSEINSIHLQLQRNAIDNTVHRDIRDM